MKNIGERIKESRIELGLSQADAARLMQISTPAFCKIETGQTDLNVSRLMQIAKVFDISANYLLTGEELSLESSGNQNQLLEALRLKDEELNKLRKKVIDLYDKLGI